MNTENNARKIPRSREKDRWQKSKANETALVNIDLNNIDFKRINAGTPCMDTNY